MISLERLISIIPGSPKSDDNYEEYGDDRCWLRVQEKEEIRMRK
jgi:hypothetical protein